MISIVTEKGKIYRNGVRIGIYETEGTIRRVCCGGVYINGECILTIKDLNPLVLPQLIEPWPSKKYKILALGTNVKKNESK